MNKVIILENGNEFDMPSKLKRYLDSNKIEWELYDMRQRFWPENEKETIKFFSELPKNQEFILETVFNGFQQLELMIELLYKLRNKEFTIKILHPCLFENLVTWLKTKESEITPKELEKPLYDMSREYSDEELDETYEKIYAFKSELIQKFSWVLSSHNISWVGRFDGDILIKDIQYIKNNENI